MLVRQITFFSIVSIIIDILLWRHGRRLFSKWKKSEAVVIKNIYVPNVLNLSKSINPEDDEDATYYAVIQFKTDKSETITKQLDLGRYPPRRIGSTLKVIYNPENPSSIVTDPHVILKAVPYILVIGGSLGLLASIILSVFSVGTV